MVQLGLTKLHYNSHTDIDSLLFQCCIDICMFCAMPYARYFCKICTNLHQVFTQYKTKECLNTVQDK